MQSFAYANPATIQEAVAQLSAKWGDADVMAGGTDLITLMKEHLHTPKRVVNIKNIKELDGIRKTEAGLRIGALVTMEELATNADVRAGYKSLADAAAGIPSPQIRNMGTVGGDLCQRPRCWYYRQGFGLLATGWVALPFWATSRSGEQRTSLVTGVGVFLICYLATFTILGYLK